MITVFTPTYNRAYILPRLYKSLLNQTDKDFEWIIVDDGSKDNTKEIIQKWIKDSKINIRYFKQENQGKPLAHNKGAEEAKGELFVCVDSDDYLTNNAIEIIKQKWNKIENSVNCVGILGMKIFKDGKPAGIGRIKKEGFCTLQDLYIKYKYKGELIIILKTQIIKKHKFPKIQGEKFISEGYIYDQIDQEGKFFIIPEKIYVCEYLPDGYTINVSNLIKNNPKGYILVAEQKLKFAKNIRQKVKACAKIILGNWLAKQKGYLKKSSHKLLMVLSIPFALYIYLKKYRNIS